MALPPLTPRYIDGITARKQDGVTGFFSKDLHGDVRYAFNSAGTEIANYVYDAWGDERTNDDAAWEINNPVRYNGQYLDSETGMYYLRARYYDPEISRFISEDPIKDGLNWYAYAGNNPIIYIDPNGLNYDEVISNLEIIYISKNIMNTNATYTIDYKDAYDSAIRAKTAIANDEVYMENQYDLTELLSVIVNKDNNSIYDIEHVIGKVEEGKLVEEKAEQQKTEEKKRSDDFGKATLPVGIGVMLVIEGIKTGIQLGEGAAQQQVIDRTSSEQTPYPTTVPVGPPNDLEDIRATYNFN